MFCKLNTFKGNSALTTWLYRITVNTVLMHFRKKVLKLVSLDQPHSYNCKMVQCDYGSRDGPASGLVDRITLTRAIKDLPDGECTIFLLHEVDGYEHQEIAKLLNCCVGNRNHSCTREVAHPGISAKPAKSEHVTVQLRKVVQEQAPSRLRKIENVDIAMI